MGNGMDKILPGLYVGNIRDSNDQVQLQEKNVTHILSIHDGAKPILRDKMYLCISASDCATQDLLQYVSQCNDFIHTARLNGGSVLVHCLAGVSRSVTITVTYIMTVTNLGWRDALNAVRAARKRANPNFGFQRQLLTFQHEKLQQERVRLQAKFPQSKFDDRSECCRLIEEYTQWVLHGNDAPTDKDQYWLPYKAYGERQQSDLDGESSATASADLDAQGNSSSADHITSKVHTTQDAITTDNPQDDSSERKAVHSDSSSINARQPMKTKVAGENNNPPLPLDMTEKTVLQTETDLQSKTDVWAENMVDEMFQSSPSKTKSKLSDGTNDPGDSEPIWMSMIREKRERKNTSNVSRQEGDSEVMCRTGTGCSGSPSLEVP